MNTFARIDELRKKFEENPRRYFAPLANEYRKAGDLDQAIALCREHLPKQPGHMSGYIVFGQALYESGELAEARTVFEQALALDPENLIALRHLGDIARASGDASSARRWYERVLDADPRNDDIAAQLASLVTGQTPASSPSVAAYAPSFARPFETPPIPMTSVGLPAMPTPDSVMRAVDLDAFAARVVHRTPIDLDTMASLTPPVEPPPIESTPSTELVDLDDDEEIVPASSAAAAPTFTSPTFSSPTFTSPSPRAEADAFDYPVESEAEPAEASAAYEAAPDSAPPTVYASSDVPAESSFAASEATDEVSSVTDDAPIEATTTAEVVESDASFDASLDESFEEGLVAPVWPDTSELVSRVMTPRSLTPRAFTPLNSAAIEDAADAFGREAHERVSDKPVSSMPIDDDVEPLLAPVAESHPEPEQDEPEHEPEHETVAEAEPEELPWLSAADPLPEEDIEGEPNEPGLEELAAALTGDARAAGEESALTVATFDEVESSVASSVEGIADEHSFADLVPEVQAEAAAAADADVALFGDFSESGSETFDDLGEELFVEESVFVESVDDSATLPVEAVEPFVASVEDAPIVAAHESSAFVTETMAELLVSQGFVGRAVDVYEELVRRRPYDQVLAGRLAELRAQIEPVADAQGEAHAERDERELADTFAEAETGYETPAVSWNAILPASPTPGYGTPSLGTPSLGTPSLGTPAHETPTYLTHNFVTPLMSPRVTPYAQPAMEEASPRRSAREWFSAIATRRVPRRTPAQSAPAVVDSPEGLASLFGEETASHDDSAARALADAFAPVTAHEMETGAALDFEYARSTPTFGSPIVPVGMTPVVPPRAVSATPAGTFAPVPPPSGGGGNAGFSFDKFFPDPATQRSTPSAPSPMTSDAPVTDDLAQFSAWLKGLGNT